MGGLSRRYVKVQGLKSEGKNPIILDAGDLFFSTTNLNKNNIESEEYRADAVLKGFDKNGFIFYTNLEGKKGKDLKANPKASMCFHWKSLLRQVRIQGSVELVDSKTADDYYNSRAYESRIGAWASSQSEVMKHRDEFEEKIKEFKKKYPDENKVPRPSYWSGWALTPYKIEFWKDVKNRLHQRLCYSRIGDSWSKELLYP